MVEKGQQMLTLDLRPCRESHRLHHPHPSSPTTVFHSFTPLATQAVAQLSLEATEGGPAWEYRPREPDVPRGLLDPALGEPGPEGKESRRSW